MGAPPGENSWEEVSTTDQTRKFHTSAVHDGKILLVGGSESPQTTEWIHLDGTPPPPGLPLSQEWSKHCSVQVDSQVFLTGGTNTLKFNLPDGTEESLASFANERELHACGVFTTQEGPQVSPLYRAQENAEDGEESSLTKPNLMDSLDKKNV